MVLLSCSDGLWGKVSDKEIETEVKGRKDIKDSIKNLISLAFIKNSSDNISISAVELGDLKRNKILKKSYPDVDKLINRKKRSIKRLKVSLFVLIVILIGLLLGILYLTKNNKDNEQVKESKIVEIKTEISQKKNIVRWNTNIKDNLYKVVVFNKSGDMIYKDNEFNNRLNFDLNKIIDKIEKGKKYFINVMVKTKDDSIYSLINGMGKELNFDFLEVKKDSDEKKQKKLNKNNQKSKIKSNKKLKNSMKKQENDNVKK